VPLSAAQHLLCYFKECLQCLQSHPGVTKLCFTALPLLRLTDTARSNLP
jgi:hypothetical protein